MELTNDFKKEVVEALVAARKQFEGGNEKQFAAIYDMKAAVWSRLKRGETEGLLKTPHWVTIGRKLGVELRERGWQTAKTLVYEVIEEDVDFCQEYSKSKILVDDCAIGKTYCAKHLSRTRRNCFYVDASQGKTRQLFIRSLAKAIGVPTNSSFNEIKEDLKYYIKILPTPIIIIDEAGDLEYNAFLELKELWNATESLCGWYLMGADGLRSKIDRGIRNARVGFREIFSRFSDKYTTIVPRGRDDKKVFYKNLLEEVISANTPDQSVVNQIVRKCLTSDTESYGGLRRAEALLILENKDNLKIA